MKFKLPNDSGKRRGFTLIELLVAISITAILGTIGFSSYNQSQMRARDAKRKQDLRALATGLEFYYQKYKHYPCTFPSGVGTGVWQYSTSTANTMWIINNSQALATSGCGGPAAGLQPFNTTFMNNMPNDPSRNTGSFASGGYLYTSSYSCSQTIGQFFALFTPLENPNDVDTHLKKRYKNCDGVVFGPAGLFPDNLYIVTSN